MTVAAATPVALDNAGPGALGQVRMTKLMQALGERWDKEQAGKKPMLALEALQALWRLIAALLRRLAARFGYRVAEMPEPTEQQLRGEAELNAELVPEGRVAQDQGEARRQGESHRATDGPSQAAVPLASDSPAPGAAAPAAVAVSSNAMADGRQADAREEQLASQVPASVAALAIEAELQRLVEHLIEQGVPENLIPVDGRDASDLEHHVRLLAQYRQVYRDKCRELEAQLDERLQPLCAHVYPDIQPASAALELVKQDLLNKDARMLMYDKSGELAQAISEITTMQMAVARVAESLHALFEASVRTDDPKAIEAATAVFARWAPDALPTRDAFDAGAGAGEAPAAEEVEDSQPSGSPAGGVEFAKKYVAQANHSMQNNLKSAANGGAPGVPAVPVDDDVKRKAGTSGFAALVRKRSDLPEPAHWQVSFERPEIAV